MTEISLASALHQYLVETGLLRDSTQPDGAIAPSPEISAAEFRTNLFTVFLQEYASFIPTATETDDNGLENAARRFGDIHGYEGVYSFNPAELTNDISRRNFLHEQLLAMAQATQPDNPFEHDREHLRIAFYAYVVLRNDLETNFDLLQKAEELFTGAVFAFYSENTPLANRHTPNQIKKGQWTRFIETLKEALATELGLTIKEWDEYLKPDEELFPEKPGDRVTTAQIDSMLRTRTWNVFASPDVLRRVLAREPSDVDFTEALNMGTLPNGARVMMEAQSLTSGLDLEPIDTQALAPKMPPSPHCRTTAANHFEIIKPVTSGNAKSDGDADLGIKHGSSLSHPGQRLTFSGHRSMGLFNTGAARRAFSLGGPLARSAMWMHR